MIESNAVIDDLNRLKRSIAYFNWYKADDLNTPGHTFPLLADSGDVLARRGHTEGTLDLIKLAGLTSKGILCELTNQDGTMARLPEVCQFAIKHEMIVLSIEDIVKYRSLNLNP